MCIASHRDLENLPKAGLNDLLSWAHAYQRNPTGYRGRSCDVKPALASNPSGRQIFRSFSLAALDDLKLQKSARKKRYLPKFCHFLGQPPLHFASNWLPSVEKSERQQQETHTPNAKPRKHRPSGRPTGRPKLSRYVRA